MARRLRILIVYALLLGLWLTCFSLVLITPPAFALDTGWLAPTSALNATFANATNAFANDLSFATRTGTNTTQRYGGYVFALPNNATVTGIEVRADAWRSAGTCTATLNTSLSWDNGTTFTSVKNSGTLGTADPQGALILGTPTDSWGHTWTTNEINSAFVVAVQTQGLAAGCTIALDWIPIRVTYTQTVGSPTSSNTATSTQTSTTTATRTSTNTFTPTTTGTATLTHTPTNTATRTPTNTRTHTATNTATRTLTNTRTPTSTSTPSSTPTPIPTAVNLLITEVVYDGIMADEGDEAAEVYNPTILTPDLGDYKFGDEETRGGSEGMYQFPRGTWLAPGQTIIIAKNAAQFRARFGFDPNFELVTTGVLTDTLSVPNLVKYSAWANGSIALSNSGDEVILLGPADQIIDSVAWGNGNFSAVGLTGDATAPAPKSLQRYGTSDRNQMTFDFLHGTPGFGAQVLPPVAPASNPGRAISNGMFAYWGDLHSHSTVSDGGGPPQMAFDTARANGLHFFGLTDHDTWITQEEWNETARAANATTVNGAFIGLRGFEYTSSDGHSNVFNSETWITRDDPNYATLDQFYNWLANQSNVVAQFNHPNWKYGGDFNNLAFNSAAQKNIALLEVGNNAGNQYATFESAYLTSLYRQWHVAPTNNSDHHALIWGNDSPHRIGIIAPALTRTDVLDAFRARRVFATEDANLAITLQSDNTWMGSTITTKPMLIFTIKVSDPDQEPFQLFFYDNGKIVSTETFASSPITFNTYISGAPSHYYFVRIVQADGDTAYTAPIWTDTTPLPTPIVTPAPKKSDLGPISIAETHQVVPDMNVELIGCVTVPPHIFSSRYLYIQDDTGGIRIYLPTRVGELPSFDLHDRVGVRGVTQGVTAERTIEIGDLRAIQNRGTCSDVPPMQYLTGDITKAVEGSLVGVRGRVVSAATLSASLDDGSGDVLVSIDSTTGLRLPRLSRGQVIRVIGVVSRAQRRPAIIPRFANDLDFGPTPTPTRTRVATARPTATRAAPLAFTATPRPTVTARPAITRTPTPRRFDRALNDDDESPGLNAQAMAIAGTSVSAFASFAFFALGTLWWVQRKSK